MGGVDVIDEVKHFGGQGLGFFGIAADGDEIFDGGGLACGGGEVDGRGGDVVAVLVKGWVVESGIPVATLPASDSVAEDVGKVVVVPE